MIKNCLLVFTLFLFSLSLVSCSPRYAINEKGYTRPIDGYSFPYSKRSKKLTSSDIIDTTAIYYLHDSNFARDDVRFKRRDEYIRFYANGHLKIQGSKDYPFIEDINDLKKGIVGYYLLKEDKIKIQIYTTLNGGSDQLKYGYVDADRNLVLYDANPRTYISLHNLFSEKRARKLMEKAYFGKVTYERIKIEGMTFEKPSW